MGHLHRPKPYDIKDSNIALLGSDLEKRVREEAGNSESAWAGAGTKPGLKVWRIEKFNVVEWPKQRYGSFYEGDAYIVLHTYKKSPGSSTLAHDLHFWLGSETSQDEAGTAAYKAVELDDHLHGQAVQYREVQNHESQRFLSYFPQFLFLRGGVASGFHHVSARPPLNVHRLYRITFSRVSGKTNLLVREVKVEAASLVEGDVYVLDKGEEILQFNTKQSVGQEKFRAAEFVHSLASEREGKCEVIVHDEGGPGAGAFLAEFGDGTTLAPSEPPSLSPTQQHTLHRISDATGSAKFETIAGPLSRSLLHTSDAFLLDSRSTIYVWLGAGASLNEGRLAIQYAQQYLYDNYDAAMEREVAIPVVRMNEGNESEDFLKAIGP
ncbi:Severin [Hypsizygus marmoreus]|uniref:Severin n=1 Tax=Hypsizygus marmoreus TaxID=39966 RepID=A0A369J0N4_HYPMA|nr:Severin [Hypsizygus marmoreus]